MEIEIKKLTVNSSGILMIKDFTNNFSKNSIYDFIKKNEMVKIAPGVYALPEVIVDETFTLSQRCTKGIISHDDALYYHGLIEREPFVHSLTIYTGYNPTRLTESGYKVYTVKKDLLDVGKIIVRNNFGNEIPIYDLERTVCDLVRNRNQFEIQDFNFVLRTYVSKSNKDLNKLMKYAKLFKIDKIIRQYLEILM